MPRKFSRKQFIAHYILSRSHLIEAHPHQDAENAADVWDQYVNKTPDAEASNSSE